MFVCATNLVNKSFHETPRGKQSYPECADTYDTQPLTHEFACLWQSINQSTI